MNVTVVSNIRLLLFSGMMVDVNSVIRLLESSECDWLAAPQDLKQQVRSKWILHCSFYPVFFLLLDSVCHGGVD